MATATDPVTVASYETVVQAEVARALLEESGIRAVLTDSELSTTQPLHYGGIGVGLQVAQADAARALEILRAREAAAREAAAEEALVEDEADVACLACGVKIPEYLERCPACGFSYA